MTRINKIEEFHVWVEARKLAKLIDRVINCLPKTEDYNLKQHLRENKRNVPANIAEGFGRFFYRESTQFYRIALGSLNEIKSDIYLCFDSGYIDKEILDECLKQIEVVNKLLNGVLTSAKTIKVVSTN